MSKYQEYKNKYLEQKIYYGGLFDDWGKIQKEVLDLFKTNQKMKKLFNDALEIYNEHHKNLKVYTERKGKRESELWGKLIFVFKDYLKENKSDKDAEKIYNFLKNGCISWNFRGKTCLTIDGYNMQN